MRLLISTLMCFAVGALMINRSAHAQGTTSVARGKYLVQIMDCGGCHTTGTLSGKPDPAGYLAGGDVGWSIPGFGIVYPRNITPDRDTGIGAWSSTDIIKLLQTGERPDKRIVAPIMNWRSYRGLTDSDVQAVAAYLKSIPPVVHQTSGPAPLNDAKTPYITVVKP